MSPGTSGGIEVIDEGVGSHETRGQLDRIDRLPSGGIEVIDYKIDTGESSIYALACRDALGLGTPERITLYFTESALRLSTTRTDQQLDQARSDVLARVSQMRAGDFGAMPSAKACEWCEYARICPEQA